VERGEGAVIAKVRVDALVFNEKRDDAEMTA
jgi:hypothetical protein